MGTRYYAIIVEDSSSPEIQLSGPESLLKNSTMRLPTGLSIQGAVELDESEVLDLTADMRYSRG